MISIYPLEILRQTSQVTITKISSEYMFISMLHFSLLYYHCIQNYSVVCYRGCFEKPVLCEMVTIEYFNFNWCMVCCFRGTRKWKEYTVYPG